MNYIKIDKDNLLNGPGIRLVLWISGCDNYCKNCHNPETWDPSCGNIFDNLGNFSSLLPFGLMSFTPAASQKIKVFKYSHRKMLSYMRIFAD